MARALWAREIGTHERSFFKVFLGICRDFKDKHINKHWNNVYGARTLYAVVLPFYATKNLDISDTDKRQPIFVCSLLTFILPKFSFKALAGWQRNLNFGSGILLEFLQKIFVNVVREVRSHFYSISIYFCDKNILDS